MKLKYHRSGPGQMHLPQLVKRFQKLTGPRDFKSGVAGSAWGMVRDYNSRIPVGIFLFFCIFLNKIDFIDFH